MRGVGLSGMVSWILLSASAEAADFKVSKVQSIRVTATGLFQIFVEGQNLVSPLSEFHCAKSAGVFSFTSEAGDDYKGMLALVTSAMAMALPITIETPDAVTSGPCQIIAISVVGP